MNNRNQNYIRNTIWGFISKVISILLPFFVRTVLIYCLDIQYVGLNALFSTILQVLSMAELGFGSALVYSMYEPIAKNDNISLCALLNLYKKIYLIIGFFIFCIGLIIMPFVPKLINGNYPQDINIYLLYLIYLGNTISSYFMYAYRASLLTAHQRNDVRNKINMLINVFLYVCQISVLLISHNYYHYIILLPIATILNNLVAGRAAKKRYPHIICKGKVEQKNLTKIKRQVVSLMWHKLGNTIIFSFDNIIISLTLGITQLGYYNNYFYIYNSIASLFSIFYDSIISGVGNSLIVQSKQKNYRVFLKFSSINFIFTAICASCLLSLYQPFMKLWQGKEMICADSIPIYLSILFVIWHSRRMVHTFKDAAGLWEIDKYRPISEAILNLFLNIILVQIYGLNGIVLSTIFAMFFVGFPWETNKFIKNFFGENLFQYYLFVVKSLLKIFIICITTYAICLLIPDSNLLYFIGKCLVSVFITLSLTFIIFRKEEGMYVVLQLLKKGKSNSCIV